MSTTIAQAILEKGLLDSASAGVWHAVDTVGAALHDYPWSVVAVAVIVGLVIFFGRR